MAISRLKQDKIEKLKNFAIKNGAEKVLTKYISAKDILIPNWPHFKCLFGCDGYGASLCCPPFIPTPNEWRKFISEYNDALIIGFNADANNFLRSLKKVNKILIKLEREAFMLDLPKAFVLFAGSCMLCKKCVIHEKDFPKNIDPRIARRFCKHLRKARPSMEGIGIDVFATLAKVGIKLHVLDISNFDKFRQFGLLLLD
ncbi:MAG: DUF2284 domain-containing protein [Candidatus Helarchaeota archaeon]